MDTLSVWNELTNLDGILFTIWLGILYYGKCWIDSKFKQEIKMDLIITIVFCIVFYKLNVELDRDIFEQYREVERDLR